MTHSQAQLLTTTLSMCGIFGELAILFSFPCRPAPRPTHTTSIPSLNVNADPFLIFISPARPF